MARAAASPRLRAGWPPPSSSSRCCSRRPAPRGPRSTSRPASAPPTSPGRRRAPRSGAPRRWELASDVLEYARRGRLLMVPLSVGMIKAGHLLLTQAPPAPATLKEGSTPAGPRLDGVVGSSPRRPRRSRSWASGSGPGPPSRIRHRAPARSPTTSTSPAARSTRRAAERRFRRGHRGLRADGRRPTAADEPRRGRSAPQGCPRHRCPRPSTSTSSTCSCPRNRRPGRRAPAPGAGAPRGAGRGRHGAARARRGRQGPPRRARSLAAPPRRAPALCAAR